MMKSSCPNDVYVMICGRVTPAQRDIIRRRSTVDMEKYLSILSWLIDNHPSYSDMTCPQACPQPVLIGGFSENQNNTDESDGSMAELESSFDGERWMFASSNEPTESSGVSSNETQFVTSYLRGEKPTLLFKNGDIVNGHMLKLIDMFPLNFPFGWGGPEEKRCTKVSQIEVLRHYSRIALLQM